MTILSFDPDRRTNAQAVAELAALGLCPEPVIDATYGLGKFWTDHTPEQLTRNDINPDKGDHHWDYRTPPSEAWMRAYQTVVFDPPYKLNGTPTDSDRYGVDQPATVRERLDGLFVGVMMTSKLVASGGYLWVKYQDQVANGQMHWQSDLVRDALPSRWKREARMFVHTGARPQRSQKRARNNYSTLEVWKRTP